MRYKERHFTFSKEHGFGIWYKKLYSNPPQACVFYEDEAFIDGKDPKEFNENIEKEINRLIDDRESRWYSISSKEEKEYETLKEKWSCGFTLDNNQDLEAVLENGKTSVRVVVKKQEQRYYASYEKQCSCGKDQCIHKLAVNDFCRKRLKELEHRYVITAQSVDKSLFLENELEEAIQNGWISEFDEPSIERFRRTIQLMDAADSADYFRAVHEAVLNLSPYDYDSHYLDDYAYLLLAMFENPRYVKAVIEPGGYADPEDYEGRQHRSNRVCFKRTRKEYEKVIKDMDVRGDYSEDEYKEFLLKYRGDDRALLMYYAYGKKKLDVIDIPFLDRIIRTAEEPEKDLLAIVAEKMDSLGNNQDGVRVFRKLVGRLSHDERIRIYGRMEHISMSTEEIRSLSREEQLKLINNTPLTRENFLHIMDTLLQGKEDAFKGRYILSILEKLRTSRDQELKDAILAKADELPDSRLLLAYSIWRLSLFLDYSVTAKEIKKALTKKGDAERELNTYFDCGYQIENTGDAFTVLFEINDPSSNISILTLGEQEGKKDFRRGFLDGYDSNGRYSSALIRKVCLEGKEEAYTRDLEKNREKVAENLFEKNHHKFVAAYRKLCEGLEDEKVLFRAEQKASVEWMIVREQGSSALSFRVGNTKPYIVKDASLFVDSFRKNVTTEYGKDLILTHDPENLNSEDAALIRLLMAAKYSAGRKSDKKNKRYITVSDSILGSIFEKLAGRTVLYNEEPCLIRLERQKVRLQISKNYELSTDLTAGEQEFLNLTGKGYVVTRTKGRNGVALAVDRVDATPDEAALIEFVDQNSAVSIAPIQKDFKKNIFNRFFELFDVDKAVAPEFRLSEMKLDSYFDYEKSVLTVRTRLWKDEKQITPDKLVDRIDLVKYELLQNYLSDLGFLDGVMAEESQILSFFKMDFTRLKSLTNVYLSDSLQNKELKTVGKPVIRVTYKNDMMQVFLEKSDYSEDELEKILAGIRKKKKFILLDGNRIIDLDNEAAEDFGEAVKDFALDPKKLYEKKTITMVTAIKAFAHEKSCRADKYLRDMIDEIRSFKESDIPVPRLNGELRGYQTEGYHWMSILSKYGMGGILADDMGLGKTIQVIALIKADKTKKPSLVVCPKSLVFNWVSEFLRFDGKTKVVEIYGTDSARSEKIASINYGEKAVYVTSYDSLRNDIAKYSGEFNYGILDEAQYIKNVHALKTKSVKELKLRHRFALTGTPIENSVVDLWSIFDYIMPGYFEELSQFKNSENTAIARKAAPFILRRVKADVLEDLPAKYERILTAELGREQRKLYDAMRQDARKRLDEGGKAFDLLPYLTRLRQICVDPGMFVEDYSSGSGKLELLAGLIPEYLTAGHRILIFSQFVKALESVQKILNEREIPFFFLSGATPAKERVEMMDSFNNGNGADVFLISLKAGGTGLNLTGADTVIHLDPWWNVAAENQATDRTHRIGQKRNVEVIRLIAENTIEQRVAQLQDMKRKVVEQVISDDDGSVTSASLEDLAFVLE